MLDELLMVILGLIAAAWLLAGPVAVIVLWRKLGDMRQQVEVLRRAQRVLASRLREQPPPPEAAGPEPEPVPPEPATEQAEPPAEVSAPLFDEGEEPRAGKPAPVPRPQPAAAGQAFDLEELLAGRWMTWVGAVALIIGAGFALKYTIDQNLIGPSGRVALGVLAGMVCFAGGAWGMLRDYRVLGQALVGAAAGIHYFSFFAAWHWYEMLLPLNVTLAGMVLVTAAVLSFAAYFDALSTAIIGLIGGFLTPYMLGTGSESPWELFGYILILDAGVLGVATFRKWQSLQVLAFVATLLVWLGWFAGRYVPELLITTLILMTIYFVLFALLGVWHNVIRRKAARPGDFFLILATPVAYFIGLYAVTYDNFSHWHGAMAIALAGSYLALAMFALARHPAGGAILLSLGGVAASFLTVAIPLQLSGHWIAIAWAAESLLLVEIGLRYGIRPLRYAGFGLLGVVQLILLFYSMETFDNPQRFQTRLTRIDPVAADTLSVEIDGRSSNADEPGWTDIFNGRSFSFLASALVLAVMAWEYRNRPAVPDMGESRGERGPPATAMGWLIAGVPLTLLVMALVETYAVGYARDWIDPTFFGLFALWTALTALVLLVMSAVVGPRWIERVSAAVFGLLALLVGVATLGTLAGWRGQWRRMEEALLDESIWQWMVINPRGLGFLAAIAAAVAGAIYYRRAMTTDERGADAEFEPFPMVGFLSLLAHVTALAMLTTEVYAHGVIRNWGTATALAITGTWTLYAIATLVTGIYYRSRLVRTVSLALFALTTAKVFLYDIQHLDKEIKTFAFIGLGVALLLVSFLYRRYRDRIRAWIAPAALLAAVAVPFCAQPQSVIAADDVPPESEATIVEKLKYRWPITGLTAEAAGAGEAQRLVRIVVPPELYGHARIGLDDVRILTIDDAGEDVVEIPYVKPDRRDTSQMVERPAPLLNLSQRGTATEFLLDLGDAAQPVNELMIEVDESERNYDRTVKVFGANRDDAEEWNLLTEEGYLLDRTRPANRLTVSNIVFPASQFRYYKVVIENGGQPPLEIDGASLFDRRKTVVKRHEYPARQLERKELAEEEATQWIFDLGFHRLPTDGVTVGVDFEGNFDRPVRIEVADQLADDPRKTRWRPAGAGNLYRIERPGLTASGLTIEYPETTGRYLRLTIAHGDDRPLALNSVTAQGIDTLLVCERRHLMANDRQLGLYCGNQDLPPPSYDLSRTIGRFDAAALPAVSLGEMSKNPHFGFRPTVPWSERNQPLLWSITIGGVVVLGLLTLLLLRHAAGNAPEPPPE